MASIWGGRCAAFRWVGDHDCVPRTLDDLSWPLTTPRLQIRRAVADDLEGMHRYRRLESVAMWMTTAPAHFLERFARPERLYGTLIIERDRAVVGDLMCQVENGYAQSDVEADTAGVEAVIGWCLDPACAGQGYGTEAPRRSCGCALSTSGCAGSPPAASPTTSPPGG